MLDANKMKDLVTLHNNLVCGEIERRNKIYELGIPTNSLSEFVRTYRNNGTQPLPKDLFRMILLYRYNIFSGEDAAVMYKSGDQ